MSQECGGNVFMNVYLKKNIIFLEKMESPAILEQIAMYMVALPCPPIPIKVNVENYSGFDDEEDKPDEKKEVICSSHDLLAGLIICAMHRNNVVLNQTRKLKQIQITKQFIQALIEKFHEQDDVDVDTFYKMCGTFTADYLQSFDDPQHPSQAIQIMGMDEVELGDKVHKSCCSWHVAQEILQIKNAKHNSSTGDLENQMVEPRKMDFFKSMTYSSLIKEQCVRLLKEDKMCSEFLNESS